ncbi:MAG: deoxynucleoside kinase [bacterium]|nr:deoxynucleoside kinase [bacterium]
MRPGKSFIAVAGNIGAGKSTLTRLLAQAFEWEPFLEAAAENPYLADFYQDMRRWSFHSQVFYLGKRLEHHRQLIDHPGNVLQDRTVYEDAEIFARNLYEQGQMSERDYDAYRRLYHAVSSFLPPPQLIVYLRGSVDTLVSHIQRRGHDYERDIPRAYLERLNRLYNAWIEDWTLCPILTLEMDQLDFQHNPAHLAMIVEQVRGQLSPA